MKKIVIFFYVSKFSGHRYAAEAVKKAIHSIDASVACYCIDAAYAYPNLGPIISQLYLEIIQKVPHIWNYLYDNPEINDVIKELREIFNFLHVPKLRKLLKEHKKAVLVCTHTIPAGIIAYEKLRRKINLPLVGIPTDHFISSYWLSEGIDLYLVPNNKAAQKLLSAGIPQSRIHITGIPIDLSFSNSMKKEEAKKHFNLDPAKPSVLLMGGANGLGPIKKMLECLYKNSFPYNCVVVTSRNKKLRNELKKKFNGRFHIYGFIKNISRIMSATDVIVTKPGGMTTSEALAMNIPMILVEPLPGQEEINAEYLVKHNLAELCSSIEALPTYIETAISQKNKIKQRLQAFAKPFAALDCAKHILNLL